MVQNAFNLPLPTDCAPPAAEAKYSAGSDHTIVRQFGLACYGASPSPLILSNLEPTTCVLRLGNQGLRDYRESTRRKRTTKNANNIFDHPHRNAMGLPGYTADRTTTVAEDARLTIAAPGPAQTHTRPKKSPRNHRRQQNRGDGRTDTWNP